MSQLKELSGDKEGLGAALLETDGMEDQTLQDPALPSSPKRKRAPRRHHIALTEQFDNDKNFKCFRIDCGFADRNGKRVRKAFYLGKDRSIAERLSTRIRARWSDIAASTFGVPPIWTVGDLAEIQLWINGKEVPLTPEERGSLMCYEVIDLFIADQAERRDAGHISWDRWRTIEDNLKWVKLHVLPDVPMRLLDEKWLMRISRAISTPTISKRTKRPISSKTAITRLNTVKCFLEWANRWNYWDAPKMFYSDRSLWFMRKKAQIRFDGGRDKSREKPVSVGFDELKLIWRYVKVPNPRTGYQLKALFLLGLNAAFLYSEYGNLHYETGDPARDDGVWRLHVEGEQWSVVGPRPKTGVWADGIRLWPETVEAIKQARAAENELALVFLNPWGRPNFVSGQRAQPSPMAWWDRLRKRIENETGVRIHSLKYIRKTAAQLVRRVSGNGSLAEMLLVHSESEMARAYHTEDYQRLNVALDDVRKLVFGELEPQPQMRFVG